MEFFHSIVRVSKWTGVAPVSNFTTTKKGVTEVEYKRSKLLLVATTTIHGLLIVWMAVQFELYFQLKGYYSALRRMRVSILMYCEIGQSLAVFIITYLCFYHVFLCSIFFTFPRIHTILTWSQRVVTDVGNPKMPFLIRRCAAISLLMHVLLCLYRIKNSSKRWSKAVLMLPFGLGLAPVVATKVLLFALLHLVELSYDRINADLSQLIRQPLHEDVWLVRQRIALVQVRHSRTVRLFSSVTRQFGPHVFGFAFFFLFKLTFICYHSFSDPGNSLWGQKTLVGELTGYFQMVNLCAFSFAIAYSADMVTEKKAKTMVLLLTLLKDKFEVVDEDVKISIQTLIIELKANPNVFMVCGHFVMSRELLHNMVLGTITLVFMLIQFQGMKI